MAKPVSSIQTTSLDSNNIQTFSPEELAIQKRTKMHVRVICSILSILTIGVGVTGITLAIILGSPIFLSLLVASALFATVAVIAYKQLTKTPDGDWEKSLSLYFRKYPAHRIESDFDLVSECAVSYYQNKTNPGIKLMIQEDPRIPFQLPLIAIPNNHPPVRGIAFNVSNDSEGRISSTETNQARAFFSTFIYCHKTFEWHLCQHVDDSPNITPFSPTEVRSCPLTLNTTTGLNTSLRQHLPVRLGHARGPKLEDFGKGNPNKIMNYYYTRALLTYENCIDEAMKHNCPIISLPLFSSVYELDSNAVNPDPQHKYQWKLGYQDLCKQALIEAVQSAAIKYPNPRTQRLLIILQDPFPAANNMHLFSPTNDPTTKLSWESST